MGRMKVKSDLFTLQEKNIPVPPLFESSYLCIQLHNNDDVVVRKMVEGEDGDSIDILSFWIFIFHGTGCDRGDGDGDMMTMITMIIMMMMTMMMVMMMTMMMVMVI